MFSSIGSNLIYNYIEYFTYLNIYLLFLFWFILLFFVLINCTILYYCSFYFNNSIIEFISTFSSLLFLVLIISPALIIILDYDLIIVPSFIIYSIGIQWSWISNVILLPFNVSFISYIDQYIISPILNATIGQIDNYSYIRINCYFYIICIDRINLGLICYISYWLFYILPLVKLTIINGVIDISLIIKGTITNIKCYVIHINYFNFIIDYDTEIIPISYLCSVSNYSILPLYSLFKLVLYSFDVTHSFGVYSFGIKIDVIPGRINSTNTLCLLLKGEYNGFCFESRGQGHLSMLLFSIVLFLFILYWYYDIIWYSFTYFFLVYYLLLILLHHYDNYIFV